MTLTSLTKTGLCLALLTAAAAWQPATGLAQPATAAARQEEVGKLAATLQSPTASQFDKVQACHRLAIIGTKEAVPALAALLSDEKLAHMARYALEPLPDPAADAALRDALGKLTGKLQVGVIDSLGVRRDEKAVDALVKLLGSPDPMIAGAAASSLGRIANPKCAQALTAALAQAPAAARPAVADASLGCAERLLAQKNKTAAIALYDALMKAGLPGHLQMAAVRGAILARGADGVPLLVAQLKSADAPMFAIALRVVREIPGKDATKAIVKELAALPEEKQALLLLALADRGDQSALPAVLAAAKSGAVPCRVAALRALARLGNASAVPVLLEAAGDAGREVAQAAQGTLGALPGKAVDDALAASLINGDSRTRHAAIEAVAQRRAAGSVAALAKVATGPDAALRLVALKALGETAGAADLGLLVNALAKSTSPDEAAAANAALSSAVVRIQDKDAVAEKILAGMADSPAKAKALLVLQLGQVGGTKALMAVRIATQDSDSAIRGNAIRALAEWPDASAAPELAGIVRATPDKALRAVAFRGYVRVVSESEAPVAEKTKQLELAVTMAADTQDRRLVLSALGETYSVGSLKLVAAYLADPALVDEAGAAAVKISAKLGAPNKAEIAPVLNQVLKSAKAKPVLDATQAQMKKLGIAVE